MNGPRYSTESNTYFGGETEIFPVVMLADKTGTPINPASGAQADPVSTVNSSTTALNSGQTFTGEWEDVAAYNSVIVAAKTDQNGKFVIQFSPDGTNIDSSLTRYYRTNQIEAPHRFTITRKYVRITFENTSASNQTYLRLQTMFGDKNDLNTPLDSSIAQDFDAIAVRPTDYHYETALGRRQGAVTWNKWGYNNDIDTGGVETIWAPGGRITFQTVANTITLQSSSANDLTGNSGANAVVVYGIDENRLSQTEVVSLNGVTPVVTTSQWLGINRVAIYYAGSGLTNAGNITVTRTTGGDVMANVPAGEGSTQQCVFYTQADHQALADWLLINVVKIDAGSKPVATIKGWVTSAVSNARYEVFRVNIDTSIENTIELQPTQPFVIGEKSMFELTAETDIDNTIVSARFSLIEVRDVDGEAAT